MKILYVQQHFATGSGEAGVRGYNLVRTLVARGHDVTVICGHNWRDRSLAGDHAKLVDERDVEGFRLVRLGVFYSNHQSVMARLRSFLTFAILAMREVTVRQADIVFASSTPLTVSVPALWARLVRGIPYVLEVRDLWPDLAIEMDVIRNPVIKSVLLAWERLAYRRAWRLVALAPGIKDGIVAKGRLHPSRVLMIPNGSDTDSLKPIARTAERLLPTRAGEFVCGYTGTIGLANGLDAVLDAAAVLKRRGNARVRFVLIGDGREKQRLMQRAAAEGLDTVSFAGLFGKSDYNRVLAELDAGMQILKDVPGFRYGTSPNKFFDYLAAGRPVVVNYPGWMSDLVTTNACGIAVPPNDPDAFADALERLCADPGRLAAMGVAARALAEREFSQQRILVDLAQFIEAERSDAATAVVRGESSRR